MANFRSNPPGRIRPKFNGVRGGRMLVSITTHAIAYHNAQHTRDEVFREFLQRLLAAIDEKAMRP
jgi:hypothetical protein